MENKTNSVFLILLAVLVISGNIYLLIKLSTQKKELIKCSNVLMEAKHSEKNLKKYILEREKRSIDSGGLIIEDSVKVRIDEQNYSSLLSLVREPFSVVFYFNSSHCQTCVDAELDRLKYHLNDVGEHIIILSSGMSQRDIEYFQKSKKLNFLMCNIKENELLLPILKDNIPFVCQISFNGFVHSVFVPELYEQKFSEQYYSHVKELIFNSYLNSSD